MTGGPRHRSDRHLAGGSRRAPPTMRPPSLAVAWSELPAGGGTRRDRRCSRTAASLIIALPDPRTNRATSYALQSILAGSANGAPVTPDAVAAAAGELAGVGPGAGPDTSADSPDTTAAALDALAGDDASFTAVPVVASDLQAYNEAADPGAELLAVHPGGPTVGDRVFVVPLSATWVDPTTEGGRRGLHRVPAQPGGPAGTDQRRTPGGRCAAATRRHGRHRRDRRDALRRVDSRPRGRGGRHSARGSDRRLSRTSPTAIGDVRSGALAIRTRTARGPRRAR